MTEKLTAILKITRPLNLSITFVTVIVAAIICQTNEVVGINVFGAAISASLVMAAGNIINDILDIEIDKINRPERPLSSNKISKNSAIVFYLTLIIASLTISWFINFYAFLIVLITTILLFIYSKYLKKIPLVGNFVIAFLTGLVFIYGGIAVENPLAAIIPALFAFLINFNREIVKDMQDVPGDKKLGFQTFPIKYGFNKSIRLILIVSIFLITATSYPFITRVYRIEYFIIVMVVVNPIIVYSVISLFEDNSKKNLDKISNLLKLSMVLGLIAIYFG